MLADRDIDIPSASVYLKRVALDLGLPYNNGEMVYNSRKAQELGLWASDQGRGEAFHMAAFKAFFVDNLNLSDLDILKQIAESVGLDPDQAADVVKKRLYSDSVDKEWAYSRESMIQVIPSFRAGGRTVAGAQQYDTLEKLLIDSGAQRK